MNRVARYLVAVFLLFLGLEACSHPQAPASIPEDTDRLLVILHTNDTHGSVWGTAEGGTAAQRASLVESIRRQVRARGGQTLLVDAGDVRSGSLCSDRQQAEPDFRAMAAMGYDAMEVGNHEFDVPYPVTLAQRELAGFPILAANVVRAQTGEPLLQPFVLLQKGPLRVAVIGVVTETTPNVSTAGADADLRFLDPTEVVQRLVTRLRPEADLLVVLSHLGLEQDRLLAERAPGIDVIVGGHSHDALSEPETRGHTLIAQAGSNGRYLGRLDLMVGPGRVRLLRGELVPVSADLTAQPEVAQLLEHYACSEGQEVVAQLDEPVTREPLEGPGSSSALGNLVGDAFIHATGAELAIYNHGGLRADLPAGDVTEAAIHAVLPFNNTLVVVDVTGDQLLDIARRCLERGPEGEGRLLPAGLEFVLVPSASAQVLIDGRPVNPQRHYRLAISSFLAGGGDRYELFSTLPVLERGQQSIAEVLTAYLRSMTPPTVDRHNRIQWIEATPSPSDSNRRHRQPTEGSVNRAQLAAP